MKRRTAVNKINSLPEASTEQLHRLDDVCAICYQEMKNAKITRCNHFFHGVCLRKWLYVQDRCPLCHDILYKVETGATKDGSSSDDATDSSNNEALIPAVEESRDGTEELIFPSSNSNSSSSSSSSQDIAGRQSADVIR
jgi:E3 ubiquitin-protein ligase RNF139